MKNLIVQKIKMLLLGIYTFLHLDLKDNSKESESSFRIAIQYASSSAFNSTKDKSKKPTSIDFLKCTQRTSI